MGQGPQHSSLAVYQYTAYCYGFGLRDSNIRPQQFQKTHPSPRPAACRPVTAPPPPHRRTANRSQIDHKTDHKPITLRSQIDHSPITNRSLFDHRSITPRSQTDHSRITNRSLPDHSSITDRSLPDHKPITPRSLPDHKPITPRSQADHSPITNRSLPDHSSITDSKHSCRHRSLFDHRSQKHTDHTPITEIIPKPSHRVSRNLTLQAYSGTVSGTL